MDYKPKQSLSFVKGINRAHGLVDLAHQDTKSQTIAFFGGRIASDALVTRKSIMLDTGTGQA